MSKKEFINTLKQISNDAWCYRTYYKAKKSFDSIRDKLTEEEANTLEQILVLDCDPDCPDSLSGKYAYEYKAYMSQYIKELIKKYD